MFERIRTIKGRQYRYQERRYRLNGKVMSESKSLGPVGGYRKPRLTLGDIVSNFKAPGGPYMKDLQRDALKQQELRDREHKEKNFDQARFLQETEHPQSDDAKEGEADADAGEADVGDEGE